MSHLGKLKPSHLYIYDRLGQDKKEAGERSRADMEEAQQSAEMTQDYKIQLKDDGLGKYKISPLGHLKDPKEMVRIDWKICHGIKYIILKKKTLPSTTEVESSLLYALFCCTLQLGKFR